MDTTNTDSTSNHDDNNDAESIPKTKEDDDQTDTSDYKLTELESDETQIQIENETIDNVTCKKDETIMSDDESSMIQQRKEQSCNDENCSNTGNNTASLDLNSFKDKSKQLILSMEKLQSVSL